MDDTAIQHLIAKTKHDIAPRAWRQRIFSLKSAHGALMFMSYFNMVGRLFSSDQSGHFGCYTYHVYKPLDSYKFSGTGRPITYVPENDPDSAKLPWTSMGTIAWGMLLSLGPLGLAFGFGALWVLADRRSDDRRTENPSSLVHVTIDMKIKNQR